MNLRVNNTPDHLKVREFFEKDKISFFTYTPNDLKPFSLVIDGLSVSYDVGDLKAYLEGLGISLNVLKIVKLKGDQWLVHVSNESDATSLFSIQYILHCRVHVRRYRQNGLVQRRNCLRFGHISSNCRLQYRCLKCSEHTAQGTPKFRRESKTPRNMCRLTR